MKKPITRREAITESVKSYIKNYPDEYRAILQVIKQKRHLMPDDSWGESIEGWNKKDDSIRLSLKLPERMLGSINELLTMHGQDILFKGQDDKEGDKEFKWFKETFPMFIVPNYKKRVW